MSLISYDTTGSGSTVLLLHAGVADRRMWNAQRQALAARHRVVSVDLRGFGDSVLPDHPYDHVTDVVAVLDELGLGGAQVVAASFGGLIAQDLAIRHPNRVERLVLLCPASVLLEPDADQQEFGAREDALLEDGDLNAATELNVERWCGPEMDEEARSLVRRMQHHAFELQTATEDLDRDPESGDPAEIIAPTLVMSGGNDVATFRAGAKRLAATIPGAEHRELEWAGHLPSLERPSEVNALLLDALAGTR